MVAEYRPPGTYPAVNLLTDLVGSILNIWLQATLRPA